MYPNEPPMGDNSILQKILTGSKNLDPEKPAQPIFNLDPLLENLAAIPSDANRKEKAMKVLALISIASMWRPGIDAAQIRFSLSQFHLNGQSYSFSNPPREKPTSMTLISLNAKNQNKQITIRQFHEQELDPVYHTWIYCQDTSDRRTTDSKDRLYLSNTAKDDTKPVQSQTLLNWMKALFKRANITLNAHKIRGLSSTTALEGGTSMDQILNAASWKSSSTFKTFYLQKPELMPPAPKRKAMIQGVGDITLERLSKRGYKHSNIESSSAARTEESLRLDERDRNLIDKDDEGRVEEEEEILLIPPTTHPDMDNVLQSFSKAECSTEDLEIFQ